jgi:pimeloyl-ACP methyl ester carboxylesterase
VAINGGLIFGHDLLWPTFAPFAEHQQVILYDQRGRGGTTTPPGAHAARIEHDALDLQALREALDIPIWDIAAHSWGAGIGLLGAANDPSGVHRIVTFGSVGPTSRWLPGLHARALAFLDLHVHDHRVAGHDLGDIHFACHALALDPCGFRRQLDECFDC